MTKLLLRVTSPKFVAGIERDGKCAPIIKFMQGWSGRQIRDYCYSKGWKLEMLLNGEWRTLENDDGRQEKSGAATQAEIGKRKGRN